MKFFTDRNLKNFFKYSWIKRTPLEPTNLPFLTLDSKEIGGKRKCFYSILFVIYIAILSWPTNSRWIINSKIKDSFYSNFKDEY